VVNKEKYMKNKKITYLLVLSIGFSSNNTFSMGWISEKLAGLTNQAAISLGNVLNRMSEWGDKKTFAFVTVGIIALVGYVGKDTVKKWFNGLMNKMPDEPKKGEDKPIKRATGYKGCQDSYSPVLQ
jgi:hypothetical protein